jgi:hypothetical protein
MADRISHAGLRGEIDHAVRCDVLEQRRQAVAIGQVQRADVDIRTQRRDPVALELRIVVVVEVVQADDGIATRTQRAADLGTNEAGCAGNEDGHGRILVFTPSFPRGRQSSDSGFRVLAIEDNASRSPPTRE